MKYEKASKKPMSKPVKIGLWVVGGLVAVSALSGLGASRESGGADAEVARVEASQAAEVSANAKAEAKKQEAAESAAKQEANAAEAASRGQQFYAEWLASRGASSSLEVLAQSPGSIQGYLVSAESPSSGTAVFTAQVTAKDVDKEELKQAAMAVLNLVGNENKSLERVEIVTADSLSRGVANRYDSKLLTLK